MALNASDIEQVGNIVAQALQENNAQVAGLVDSRINQAQFGGSVVQVAPSDLVYLGGGRYVSESKEHVYQKGPNGTLLDMGEIPEPV